MTYRAPVSDILFTMRHAAGFDQAVNDGIYGDLSADLVQSILEEGAKVAGDVIAPLNAVADKKHPQWNDRKVTTSPGWKDAYKTWADGGWNSLGGPEKFGGQGLPILLNTACQEMWNAASMAFGIGPTLTMGAVEALVKHGSKDLQDRYLPKLISGEWMGTMNLTEPQAGSDLALLRARAERNADGTYRIFGEKIFITYGEHDLTDNIIHLVLARLPDAPPGVKGISLFLVPKFMPDGTRNDAYCQRLEDKMGIHGSPTATMIFGDKGGAVGWLIGEENRGLACMFTMMNNARLAVGIQGVSIADRAYQQALAYANDRKQGNAPGAKEGPSPIIVHPDIQHMLLTMKALCAAARAICYMTAESLDRAHHEVDDAKRKVAADKAALLTPVAKAFSTDIGEEAASLGIQVHGGMGFIEETGAAQHLRDARIAQIYEGTNGIQAIDLVVRKLPLGNGDVVKTQIASMRKPIAALSKLKDGEFGDTAARLAEAVDALDRATAYEQKALGEGRTLDVLTGSTSYLRLFGLAQGGAALAQIALAAAADRAAGDKDPAHEARIALCRFFAEALLPAAPGLEQMVLSGASCLAKADAALV